MTDGPIRVARRGVVYISGPLTAPTAELREPNIRRVEDALVTLTGMGIAAINVHSAARTTFGTLTEDHWLAVDMRLLERCDAVFVVGPFERSKGTKLEIAYATGRGIPVFYDLDSLLAHVGALNGFTAPICPLT